MTTCALFLAIIAGYWLLDVSILAIGLTNRDPGRVMQLPDADMQADRYRRLHVQDNVQESGRAGLRRDSGSCSIGIVMPCSLPSIVCSHLECLPR